MALHDWTRVDAGIFHDFHQAWNAELRGVLNSGLLPKDYYALIEQHAARHIPDLLTLHSDPPVAPLPTPSGGIAVAEVRSKGGHRLIALVEIVAPANKDREESVRAFADKAVEALRAGVHVMVIDFFPPGPADPHGMHGAIWSRFDTEQGDWPEEKPLLVASYLAAWVPEARLEHLAVDDNLPDMALFPTSDVCVPLPLEATYQAAHCKAPAFWRDVLERRDRLEE